MILGVVQARVSSTRLPGKVLQPILGEPMLARQLERVCRAERIDALVVGTSADASDGPLEELCAALGVDCFRGSLEDVLDRFHAVAVRYGAEHIVRLTSDCPLADPAVVDAVVELHVEGGYDYTSNVTPPTFPDGLDVEVISAEALAVTWGEATLPSEREHVTPFVRKHPERFRLGNLVNAEDLSGLRWTVDEPEDLEFVRRVYEALYPRDPAFEMRDVLELLGLHPELQLINARFERNEGMKPSLEADRGAAAEED